VLVITIKVATKRGPVCLTAHILKTPEPFLAHFNAICPEHAYFRQV